MTEVQLPTAQILQFPIGGRRGLPETKQAARPEMAMPRGSTLGAGESWYHAEAIQAAQQAIT